MKMKNYLLASIYAHARNPRADLATASRYWRIYIINTHGSVHAAISELEFMDDVLGIDKMTAPYPILDGIGPIVSSNHDQTTHYFLNAFDDDINTKWASVNSAIPAWIGYDFGDVITIKKFTLTPRADSSIDQFPRDIILQRSDDGIEWFDYIFYTTAAPALGVLQEFIVPGADIVIDDLAASVMYGIQDNEIIIDDIAGAVIYGLKDTEIIIDDLAAAVIYTGV